MSSSNVGFLYGLPLELRGRLIHQAYGSPDTFPLKGREAVHEIGVLLESQQETVPVGFCGDLLLDEHVVTVKYEKWETKFLHVRPST